jgi:cellulose synthase/poly-beta-1,6-N-acetylglucosamine synthase-like glycosyltransferase
MTLFWIIVAITLPGTAELLVLSIAGMFPPRQLTRVQRKHRLAIVVPAHNEQLDVARCVRSLRAAIPPGIEAAVIVIADNCNDLTESAAATAGARVLVRRSLTERGKGYALDFAFRMLEAEHWDAFAVVDADSVVASNFVAELSAALQSGADAVQCRYLATNSQDSMRIRLKSVGLAAFNVLRPRGRDQLGLSAGIYGNGFGLSAETLREVPYRATSIVEDLEYHYALVRAGRKVRFLDGTAVYADIPSGGTGVKSQRARWEGGRLRMLVEKTPGLIRDIAGGNLALVEPCLDLLLLPLAFHASLLLLAAAAGVWPVRAIALAGLSVVALHLMAAIHVTGGGPREFAALLGAPFYIAWKILMIPRLWNAARSGAAWARTERSSKRNIP